MPRFIREVCASILVIKNHIKNQDIVQLQFTEYYGTCTA